VRQGSAGAVFTCHGRAAAARCRKGDGHVQAWRGWGRLREVQALGRPSGVGRRNGPSSRTLEWVSTTAPMSAELRLRLVLCMHGRSSAPQDDVGWCRATTLWLSRQLCTAHVDGAPTSACPSHGS
jgi:hypothetical protein